MGGCNLSSRGCSILCHVGNKYLRCLRNLAKKKRALVVFHSLLLYAMRLGLSTRTQRNWKLLRRCMLRDIHRMTLAEVDLLPPSILLENPMLYSNNLFLSVSKRRSLATLVVRTRRFVSDSFCGFAALQIPRFLNLRNHTSVDGSYETTLALATFILFESVTIMCRLADLVITFPFLG